MSRRKRLKIEAASKLPNVIDFEDRPGPGWHHNFFGVRKPLILEVGCGYGEFCVEMARRVPERNFIGLDIKGARIWKGASTAVLEQIPNIAFLRTPIEHIADFFERESVQEIWITFPDPYPKKYNSTKRLTSPFFLAMYGAILVKNGVIHLKTDNERLYDYTLRILKTGGHKVVSCDQNLHAAGTAILPNDFKRIVTRYERQFIRERVPIRYLSFSLSCA